MADTRLGKIGITVKEPWSKDISYEVLDMTLFAVENGGDGCSYVALRNNIGVTPGTDPNTWVKSTQAGQSIYDLAVKYHHFVGTEEEFEADYQAALQAARDAAAGASAVEAQVEAAETARVAAETGRADAESARQSAEASRASAETARGTAEAARQSAESGRASAETARVTAEQGRASAESDRVSAEAARAAAETDRVSDFSALKTDMETAIGQADAATAAAVATNNQIQTAETGRVSAEQGRVSAETARASAESARATAESGRATAETARATAEGQRATAEGQRVTAENARVSAESGRASAESARVTAEAARVSAETARESQASSDHTRAESDHEIAAEDHATLDEKIAHKADIDGDYALLNAGTSDNFRGQNPDSDEYTLRMTGWNGEGTPTEVANGSAPVTKIEGNAAAVNQLVQNGDFTNTSNWTTVSAKGTLSVANGKATVGYDEGVREGTSLALKQSIRIINGHKYFVCYDAKPYVTGRYYSGYFGTPTTQWFDAIDCIAGVSQRVSKIITANSDKSLFVVGLYWGSVLGASYFVTGDTIEISNAFCFDLTLIFGSGNEPTTVAEFEKWLEKNGLSAPYIPNMQTLLGAKMTGAWSLPSVNLLDPTTKTARLKAYVNSTTGTGFANNQYTVKNLPTGATLSFTPDATGVAETLTPDANDRITISGTGTLTVVTNDSVAGSFVCATWDGAKDDAPDEYQKDAKPFDLSKVYGILDGESALSQVFPDGVMRKADYAGTVRDWIDLTKAEAGVKVGEYTITGQESWNAFGGAYYAISGLAAIASNSTLSAIADRLVSATIAKLYNGNVTSGIAVGGSNIYISSSDYADLSNLVGMKVFYILATPKHYTGLVYRDNGVDTPISELKFLVNNWSTQGVDIPAFVDGAPVAVAPRITQIFGPDYREMVDTLSDMMGEMYAVSDVKANLQGLLEALKTANIISAYTLTDPAAGGKIFTYAVTKYTE